MTSGTSQSRRSDSNVAGAMGYALRQALGTVMQGGAVGVAWEASVAVAPLLAQRAIDQGIVAGDWRRLALWLGLLLASGVMTAVFSGMRHRAATLAGAQSAYGLRGRLARHLLGLSAGFHDQADRGDVLVRVSTDTDTVGIFIDLIVTWTAHAGAIVIMVVLMLQMDLELGLIGTAYIPLVFLLMWAVRQAYEGRTTRLREASAKITGILHAYITGVRVIKGFGVERHQRARYEPFNTAVIDRSMSLAVLGTMSTVIGNTLPAIALVAVFWRGGMRAIAGDVTVGVLVAFGAWMVRLFAKTHGLMYRLMYYMQARASATRIDPLLDMRPAIDEPENPEGAPALDGQLRFVDVTVAFDNRPVLDGISLDVPPGETVVLVGKSGSGKSMLLNLPPRLYDPQGGGVFLDGVDVRDLALDELRAAVCLVTDDSLLFKDTIAANIALGVPGASLSQIEEAARVAQAHPFIEEMPEGYDSVVGERGLTLSGGQRQRIAVARAILVESRVLLLDDVSSSLDPTTDTALWRALARTGDKRTLLVATQRRRIAALADRVVLLDAGRVAAQGTDQELWDTTPLYRQVLGEGSTT